MAEEWLTYCRLRLAKRFNFMILEDDAYYFVNFEGMSSKRARSYLALEREANGETGRVLRFDSLSKIVSAGMRVGVLTAPVAVIQKVCQVTENIKYVERPHCKAAGQLRLMYQSSTFIDYTAAGSFTASTLGPFRVS